MPSAKLERERGRMRERGDGWMMAENNVVSLSNVAPAFLLVERSFIMLVNMAARRLLLRQVGHFLERRGVRERD